ncbi:hypothetical protein A3758_04220 [Oleiphilus sp. HI0118]|nr:hypothetical protein A3758_04220 [Oleiphilus sp. HI0118]KZZ80857.1 hypothetical protein A3767_29440 [Oleiphilus sp. HI0133]KZZ80891.1 hypothetical protein A3767_09165 [Oleiphilus sp. HI0133]
MASLVSKKEFAIYYAIGVVAGLIAWKFGESWIPVFILERVSGIGIVLVSGLIFATILTYLKFRANQPLDCFTDWLSRYAVRGAGKAATLLFGTITVAFISWISTGSEKALQLAVNTLFFMGAFSILSHQLRNIRDDAIKKGE